MLAFTKGEEITVKDLEQVVEKSVDDNIFLWLMPLSKTAADNLSIIGRTI
jgi:DNA polymerase III delta subunit